MRTVRARKWREMVRAAESDQVHPAYRGYMYYARRRYFNKLSLLASNVGLFLLIGLYARVGNVLALALLLFLGYLYLKTRSLAEGIHARRKVPAKATECEKVVIEFEIENRSAFAATDLLLIDHFNGALAAREIVWIDDQLPAHGVLHGSYAKTCDAGMGIFGFSELTIVVSDPLGVFEFLVTSDVMQNIEVYPKLEPVPQLPLHGSRESFHYGLYDLPTRGTSVNFAGIRDYARGDPLRFIAWRLSVRNGRLLVKEFEKIANTEIAVFLNMDARDHMGRKSESTWEYSKDAALALLTQQMANGNTIQFFSNARYVESGRGEAHTNLIARVIFNLVPTPDANKENLVERYRHLIPMASTVLYVGPLYGSDTEALLRSFLKLRHEGIEVVCVLVHPSSFVAGKVHGEMKLFVDSNAWRADTAIEKFALRLAREGLTTYLLANRKPIGNSMLAARQAR
ncbi:MAG: DUF58 domain-containing protein [Deltaproteobacteria bacterium]|nr:DUF58 domain-containing protein [Deltaproteobacteria bacterium]